jgi:poly(3-hydroxybutyrate) depolymerase
MIQEHNLYLTDWRDARDIPLAFGAFDLDDYLIELIRFIGDDTHVVAVGQPSVQALAAAALMAVQGDPCRPASPTLMGGPIDTRRNPILVNQHAQSRPIEWFQRNVIDRVPWPNPSFMRRVYPGFVQLTGFMTMNLERHIDAHAKLFDHFGQGRPRFRAAAPCLLRRVPRGDGPVGGVLPAGAPCFRSMPCRTAP